MKISISQFLFWLSWRALPKNLFALGCKDPSRLKYPHQGQESIGPMASRCNSALSEGCRTFTARGEVKLCLGRRSSRGGPIAQSFAPILLCLKNSGNGSRDEDLLQSLKIPKGGVLATHINKLAKLLNSNSWWFSTLCFVYINLIIKIENFFFLLMMPCGKFHFQFMVWWFV